MDIGDNAALREAEFLAAALSRHQPVSRGGSLSHCEDCGDAIPAERQKAVVGVHLCVACQSEVERQTMRANK